MIWTIAIIVWVLLMLGFIAATTWEIYKLERIAADVIDTNEA